MYSKNTTKFDKFLITKILEYRKLLVPLKKICLYELPY